MSKKTAAYGEGYTAGEIRAGIGTNPYDASAEADKHSDWKTGYADAVADNSEEDEEEFEEEDGDYDEDDDEDE